MSATHLLKFIVQRHLEQINFSFLDNVRSNLSNSTHKFEHLSKLGKGFVKSFKFKFLYLNVMSATWNHPFPIFTVLFLENVTKYMYVNVWEARWPNG